jgi:hypothetical protein
MLVFQNVTCYIGTKDEEDCPAPLPVVSRVATEMCVAQHNCDIALAPPYRNSRNFENNSGKMCVLRNLAGPYGRGVVISGA